MSPQKRDRIKKGSMKSVLLDNLRLTNYVNIVLTLTYVNIGYQSNPNPNPNPNPNVPNQSTITQYEMSREKTCNRAIIQHSLLCFQRSLKKPLNEGKIRLAVDKEPYETTISPTIQIPDTKKSGFYVSSIQASGFQMIDVCYPLISFTLSVGFLLIE